MVYQRNVDAPLSQLSMLDQLSEKISKAVFVCVKSKEC